MNRHVKQVTFNLLIWIVLIITGCSNVSVVHTQGELPKIDVNSSTIDKFCTKDFDAKIKKDQFIISCKVKI